MTPSRRGDSGRARTAQERERDRLERDRRRSRDRGAASPFFDAEEAPLDLPPSDGRLWSDPAPPAHDTPGEVHDPPPEGYHDPAQAYSGPPEAHPDLPQASAQGPAYAEPFETYEPPAAHPPGAAEPVQSWTPAPGAEDGAVAGPRRGGSPRPPIPAALARASTAISGGSAQARARAQKLVAQRRSRAPAGDVASGGSLRASRRSSASGRTAGPRTRPRVSQVSRTNRKANPPGAPRSRRGRIGAVVALVGAVIALWFLFSLFQPLKGAGHGSVAINIPAGSSSGAIGTLLANRGVVSSGFFFKLRATLAGKRSKLESGHFTLRLDMSYGAAIDALTSHQSKATQITVTVPEGLARAEIAPIAKRDGITGDYFRASVHSHVLKPAAYGAPPTVRTLEGFLFPATYDLLPGDPASKLINAQLSAFRTNIAKVDLSRAKSKHLSTYDVLTIASMVEREAQLASERPLIAAVIYNRLHSGMPLGIDATIRYAINDYSRPLTASDLNINSPYNSRRHKGLPPTPIGNPGLASIQAAAHPAAVSYMYYVVKPGVCGAHAFSTTFTQFQQDAARYNNARTAKGGKSPSSCGR